MEKKLTTIKERILVYADFKKIGKEYIVNKIGMTYGNFKGENKKRPLNSDAIENILTYYEDINPEWLLTGSGEMLRKEVTESQKDAEILALKDQIIKLQEKIIKLQEDLNELKSAGAVRGAECADVG